MSISDYNSNKDLNVTIDGVQIDDGHSDFVVPFAIRTIMADLAAPQFTDVTLDASGTSQLTIIGTGAGADTRVVFQGPTNTWWLFDNGDTTSIFSLRDVTNGTLPLRVVEAAPNNALRIEANGDVGLGVTATEPLDISGDAIRLRTSQTPASASATGSVGTIAWDSSYIYVCTGVNTWKRAALSTW